MNAITPPADIDMSETSAMCGGISATSRELLYTPGESIFAAAAPDMVANGWSVFPQQQDRRPGYVYNAMIKWSEDHDLRNRRPPPETLALWCGHCAPLNVACVFGPASGHTFALDIDVLDEVAAADITCLADEMLGYTPLRREGRFPKIALIYRHGPADGDRIASRKIGIAVPPRDADETAGTYEIEVQGAGKLITFHGRHHKTGGYFKWLDQNPQLVGPETAPLVTPAQFAAFVAAVEARYGKPDAAGWVRHEVRSSAYGNGKGALIAPNVRRTGPEGEKISDGREALLHQIAFQTVRCNPGRILAARDDAEALAAVMDSLAGLVADAWSDGAVMSGRWTPRYLAAESRSRVRRLARQLIQGRIQGDYRYEQIVAERHAEHEAAREKAAKEAAKEQKEAEQRKEEPAYKILGHDRGRYYILARGGQVRDFSARELATEATLVELDHIDNWFKDYLGAKGGINAKRAANDIITEAYRVGIYDPDRLRGRGIHLDGDKVVAHLGDRLIVDGKPMAPHEYSGRYMYEVTRPLPIAIGEPPLTAAEAGRLVDLCNALPLEDGYGSLLAGWIVIASVCGAMPWRPHAWICGEAGSGKSWALENIINPVLGGIALPVQSKTTEAGIRGTLRTDARPVIFDEAETQNQRDRDRIQQILDLARQASAEGGPDILKGTADGGSRAYRIRSCFVFMSINLGLSQAADESRAIVFDFRPSSDVKQRQESFERLKGIHREVMTADFGGRLLSRTMALLPVIRSNAEVFAQAIARAGRTRRLGDTLGVPLAGLWSLTNDAMVTPEEADSFLAGTPWIAKASSAAAEALPEWRRAIDHLIQIVSRVPTEDGKPDNLSLGSIIECAADRRGYPSVSNSQMILEEWGIRLERVGSGHTVLIANQSKGLADAFRDSPWGSSWSATVGRAPGATKSSNSVRFASLKSRYSSIPLDVFLGD